MAGKFQRGWKGQSWYTWLSGVARTIPVYCSRLALVCHFNPRNRSFTLSRAEVYQLVNIMNLTLWIQCSTTRVKHGHVIALCKLLRRLVYPTRFADVGEIWMGEIPNCQITKLGDGPKPQIPPSQIPLWMISAWRLPKQETNSAMTTNGHVSRFYAAG